MALAAKGESLPRPNFTSTNHATTEPANGKAGEDNTRETVTATKKSQKSETKKKNFEATSDEGDGEESNAENGEDD